MACDECAIAQAELHDVRANLAHLERVAADRAQRPSEDAMMVKVLKTEIAKLRRENAELRALVVWQDADH